MFQNKSKNHNPPPKKKLVEREINKDGGTVEKVGETKQAALYA